MAIATIIDAIKGTDSIQIDTVTLDVEIREIHDKALKVTEFPIEGGASMNEHVIHAPDELILEGEISDTPISFFGNAKAVGRLVSGNNTSLSQAGYDALVKIKNAGNPITVVTTHETYDDMILYKLSVPREVSTGGKIRFVAYFSKVLIADSASIGLPAGALGDAAKADASTKEAGNQAAKPVAAPPEKGNSLLRSFL